MYLSNMQSTFHIFVYGSLRSGFKSPAYNYISKYFSLVGEAKVQGKLYNMGNYPVAKPTTENTFIVGELYKINNTDEFGFAIAQLDDYEGLFAEEDETPLYYRTKENIICLNGTIAEAWVYWFNGDVSNKPSIESGDVLAFYANQQH
jgi:gamma-glutamylcyclotransferase (GGCT)/AIG2-like uncharacterized protein YtfP